MKYTVYALADPASFAVRYVGQTSGAPAHRFLQHIQAAQRDDARPVYEWIRQLHPAAPVMIVLEELECDAGAKVGEHPAAKAEVKWKKRFRRSPLLCSLDEHRRAYQELVNR